MDSIFKIQKSESSINFLLPLAKNYILSLYIMHKLNFHHVYGEKNFAS